MVNAIISLYNARMMTRQQSHSSQSSNTPDHTPPDHLGLLIAAALLAGCGWFGLYQLVQASLPRIGGELWLFFVLLQLTVTGTVLPIVRYLNVRFTAVGQDVPASGIIVRQSVWVGLYVVTCAWLQIPRALTIPPAIFIAVVFIVVEVFLRTRELAIDKD